VSGSASASASGSASASRSSVRVLVVGCGNSALSKSLYDDGFTDIESVDYSSVVINQMQVLYRQIPELRFCHMDVRSLTYVDQHFDVVIDKGTLDAVLCGSDSTVNATHMLNECHRVLKNDGVFIVITYGAPQTRLCYLEQNKYSWQISTVVLPGTRYMYVAKKQNDSIVHK